MKLNTRSVSAGIISVAFAISACSDRKHQSEAATLPDVEVASVIVDSVTLYKSYPGTLSASSTVELVARVNGYLSSINYSGGDLVEKGQVLFRIEDGLYTDAVNKAKADLETAISSNKYAASHYEAVKKASESDAVSQMEVLQAKSALEESESAIKSARAELHTATTNLGYCTIRAPFKGHITTSGPSVGAYLGGEGSTPTLATIYDDATLHADFFIEDDSFIRMFANGDGKLKYDSIPISFKEPLPHEYSGELIYTSPDVDTGTGTLKLRARVANKYNELRDGMYINISLPYDVVPKAILVLDAALSTDTRGKYLYTVNDSNRVVYTPVKVGDIVRDTMRLVTEGLDENSRYVTKALLKVRPGMEIKPVSRDK